MRVTIFGATGMVGKYLVKQALSKGHQVVAFGRNIEQLLDEDLRDDNLTAVKGYVFDEDDVRQAIKDADAVLSALGGGFDGVDKTRSIGMKNIISQMQKTNLQRIIAIGGMGVLNASDDSLILDSPGYPPQYLPVGKEHLQAFKLLNASSLDWTFVCPPTIKDTPADEKYTTSESYQPTSGKNEVSAGNIAHFMLSELHNNKYTKQRVGIADIS